MEQTPTPIYTSVGATVAGFVNTYVSGFFMGAGFVTAAILIRIFFHHGACG